MESGDGASNAMLSGSNPSQRSTEESPQSAGSVERRDSRRTKRDGTASHRPLSFSETAALGGLYGPPKEPTLTERTGYEDLVGRITPNLSRAELEDLVRFQARAIEGWRYLAKKHQATNEQLRKRLTEHDRTITFYRYHKGAKS